MPSVNRISENGNDLISVTGIANEDHSRTMDTYSTPDGVPVRMDVFDAQSGDKISTAYYDDKGELSREEFFRDGTLERVDNYAEGGALDTSDYYDTDGNLTRTEHFNADGEPVSTEELKADGIDPAAAGNVETGVPTEAEMDLFAQADTGEELAHSDNTELSENEPRDGRERYEYAYRDDGSVDHIDHYDGDGRHDRTSFLDEHGELDRVEHYGPDGHETSTDRYVDGEKTETVTERDDSTRYEVTKYDGSGNVDTKEYWNQGRENPSARDFYEDGEVTAREEYRADGSVEAQHFYEDEQRRDDYFDKDGHFTKTEIFDENNARVSEISYEYDSVTIDGEPHEIMTAREDGRETYSLDGQEAFTIDRNGRFPEIYIDGEHVDAIHLGKLLGADDIVYARDVDTETLCAVLRDEGITDRESLRSYFDDQAEGRAFARNSGVRFREGDEGVQQVLEYANDRDSLIYKEIEAKADSATARSEIESLAKAYTGSITNMPKYEEDVVRRGRDGDMEVIHKAGDDIRLTPAEYKVARTEQFLTALDELKEKYELSDEAVNRVLDHRLSDSAVGSEMEKYVSNDTRMTDEAKESLLSKYDNVTTFRESVSALMDVAEAKVCRVDHRMIDEETAGVDLEGKGFGTEDLSREELNELREAFNEGFIDALEAEYIDKFGEEEGLKFFDEKMAELHESIADRGVDGAREVLGEIGKDLGIDIGIEPSAADVEKNENTDNDRVDSGVENRFQQSFDKHSDFLSKRPSNMRNTRTAYHNMMRNIASWRGDIPIRNGFRSGNGMDRVTRSARFSDVFVSVNQFLQSNIWETIVYEIMYAIEDHYDKIDDVDRGVDLRTQDQADHTEINGGDQVELHDDDVTQDDVDGWEADLESVYLDDYQDEPVSVEELNESYEQQIPDDTDDSDKQEIDDWQDQYDPAELYDDEGTRNDVEESREDVENPEAEQDAVEAEDAEQDAVEAEEQEADDTETGEITKNDTEAEESEKNDTGIEEQDSETDTTDLSETEDREPESAADGMENTVETEEAEEAADPVAEEQDAVEAERKDTAEEEPQDAVSDDQKEEEKEPDDTEREGLEPDTVDGEEDRTEITEALEPDAKASEMNSADEAVPETEDKDTDVAVAEEDDENSGPQVTKEEPENDVVENETDDVSAKATEDEELAENASDEINNEVSDEGRTYEEPADFDGHGGDGVEALNTAVDQNEALEENLAATMGNVEAFNGSRNGVIDSYLEIIEQKARDMGDEMYGEGYGQTLLDAMNGDEAAGEKLAGLFEAKIEGTEEYSPEFAEELADLFGRTGELLGPDGDSVLSRMEESMPDELYDMMQDRVLADSNNRDVSTEGIYDRGTVPDTGSDDLMERVMSETEAFVSDAVDNYGNEGLVDGGTEIGQNSQGTGIDDNMHDVDYDYDPQETGQEIPETDMGGDMDDIETIIEAAAL